MNFYGQVEIEFEVKTAAGLAWNPTPNPVQPTE